MSDDIRVFYDMRAALDRIYEGKVCDDPDEGFRAGWNAAMRWAHDEVKYERDMAHRRHPQFILPRAEEGVI